MRTARPSLALASALLAACSVAPTQPPPTLPPPVPLGERLLAEIEMPGDPDWMVTGFESVWVKRDDGNVVRIDPASHEIVATIDADASDPGLCQGIGSDGTSIWACAGPDIVRIDPATNEVVDVVEAHKIFVQGRLVFAAGRVWVLNGERGDLLVGIDIETLEAGEPIALDAACYDLAVGDDAIWAACPSSNVVVRIDPAAASVTDRVEVSDPYSVSVGSDAAWVATTSGLSRIDLDDHAVTSLAFDPEPGDEVGIWVEGGSVWARTPKTFLVRVDAATLRIVETISDPGSASGDVVVLDGTLWASDFEGRVVHLRIDAP